MTNNVNPPPRLEIPKQFLSDPVTVAYFRQVDTILFQLWRKTGGSEDPISDLSNTIISTFNSQQQWLQKQIDGLPEFTCDTSGFTADLSTITTDKVIA